MRIAVLASLVTGALGGAVELTSDNYKSEVRTLEKLIFFLFYNRFTALSIPCIFGRRLKTRARTPL
jgi:hypothetical protein